MRSKPSCRKRFFDPSKKQRDGCSALVPAQQWEPVPSSPQCQKGGDNPTSLTGGIGSCVRYTGITLVIP